MGTPSMRELKPKNPNALPTLTHRQIPDTPMAQVSARRVYMRSVLFGEV